MSGIRERPSIMQRCPSEACGGQAHFTCLTFFTLGLAKLDLLKLSYLSSCCSVIELMILWGAGRGSLGSSTPKIEWAPETKGGR